MLHMLAGVARAQQVPDLDYAPPLARPAYGVGKGPRVAVDEAHHNFHTVVRRYKPFARWLRRDGYRVSGLGRRWSAESLRRVDVLVVANALNGRNARDWLPPTLPAFGADEVAAVRAWVAGGGALLLIADHPPFPAAARGLAGAFGVEFQDGMARAGHWDFVKPDLFEPGLGLMDGAVTRGRDEQERVTAVATFVGSAFRLPAGGTGVLVFGPHSVSVVTREVPGQGTETSRVPIEGWCQGGVFAFGDGRVAVFGEAAMFSAQRSGPKGEPMGMNTPEGRQNHQFVLNVLHWLTRAEGMPEDVAGSPTPVRGER